MSNKQVLLNQANSKIMDIQNNWTLLAMLIALTAFVVAARRRLIDDLKKIQRKYKSLQKRCKDYEDKEKTNYQIFSKCNKAKGKVKRKQLLIRILFLVDFPLSIAVIIMATSNTVELMQNYQTQMGVVFAILLFDFALLILFAFMIYEWVKSFFK